MGHYKCVSVSSTCLANWYKNAAKYLVKHYCPLLIEKLYLYCWLIDKRKDRGGKSG